MELNGVLTKRGLLLVLSTTSGAGGGETPTKLFFQEFFLKKFLQLAVNNTALWWTMGKGVIGRIRIWGWLKVSYKTAAKL